MPLLRSPLPLLMVLLCACLETPPSGSTETSLRVVSVTALDRSGQATPLSSIARRPVFEVITTVPIDALEPPVFLFDDVAPDELIDDLDSPPLRSNHQAVVIPARVTVDGTQLRIEPSAPLQPGQHLSLAVAAWAMGAAGERWEVDADAFIQTLRVSTDASAGANAIASWPAHGAAGVAPNLTQAVIVFDGALDAFPSRMTFTALDPAMHADVDANVDAVPCETAGFAGSTCLALTPDAALSPLASYTLAVDDTFTDATGSALTPWNARFTTAAAEDATAPSPLPKTCAADESAWPLGCALITDHSITLRMAADEPFRASIAGAACAPLHVVATRGETTLTLRSLTADTNHTLAITLQDAAGNTFALDHALHTRSDAATIAITEVRADPFGSEPAQEYVELFNFGSEAVDLYGFALSDDAFDEGDAVPEHVWLHPAGRALLVADDFDALDPRDVAPAPGAPLIRIGASLGDGGLSNTGEALYLRDPSGARLSTVPRMSSAGAGVCSVRAMTGDVVDGLDETFVHDASRTCTPGL